MFPNVWNIEVREAGDKDVLRPGLALIAPGDNYLHVARSGSVYQVQIKQGHRVCLQRPSAKVMMDSMACPRRPSPQAVWTRSYP